MKKRFPIIAAGILAGLVSGQDLLPDGQAFQVFGPNISAATVLDEGFGRQVVRGKPFTATEERHSLQILGDGTRIETTQKNRVFRDSQGRTRVEEMNGVADIFDPVTNRRVELDPTAKTAREGGFFVRNLLSVVARVNPRNTKGVMSETTENLKAQSVNGVMAQGVRTTMTIPKGQIGNDRDIKVVTERWVSNDLQMLIKSTNSDPRFGETTYQLTGIDLREPEASLFQVPTGYAVVNEGGRGAARSPTPGGRKGAQPLEPNGDLLKDKK